MSTYSGKDTYLVKDDRMIAIAVSSVGYNKLCALRTQNCVSKFVYLFNCSTIYLETVWMQVRIVKEYNAVYSSLNQYSSKPNKIYSTHEV